MYDLAQLLRGLRSPRDAIMELNSLYTHAKNSCDYNPDGEDFIEADWDTLIILDSCRYDVFEQQHDLPGELDFKISRGGATREFLRGNFRNRELLDTVYLTAIPQYHRLQDELDACLHEVRDLWRDKWDTNLQTVPPEAVTTAAKNAVREFPHKRLIVHYAQPHGPYIGETGRSLVLGPQIPTNDLTFFEGLRRNLAIERLSDEQHWRAYRENLDIVLPYVEELFDVLDGKTVVTADHGQMLGERAAPIPIKCYDHHGGTYVDPLVKVPWLVYEKGPRREIAAEEPTSTATRAEESVVSERLSALGYTE